MTKTPNRLYSVHRAPGRSRRLARFLLRPLVRGQRPDQGCAGQEGHHGVLPIGRVVKAGKGKEGSADAEDQRQEDRSDAHQDRGYHAPSFELRQLCRRVSTIWRKKTAEQAYRFHRSGMLPIRSSGSDLADAGGQRALEGKAETPSSFRGCRRTRQSRSSSRQRPRNTTRSAANTTPSRATRQIRCADTTISSHAGCRRRTVKRCMTWWRPYERKSVRIHNLFWCDI